MNIQRDTEYRFGELVLSPEYLNEQGVVVTIKSLATGLTMKVYLDEPTQSVEDGINVTSYTGHFNEEEFMVTPSEGYEITGLPLMYPYPNPPAIGNMIIVIDTENHHYSTKDTGETDPRNILEFGGIEFGMLDVPISKGEGKSTPENEVFYRFTQFGGTSEEPIDPK